MDMFWGSISWAETDIDDLGTATQTQIHAGLDLGNGLSGFVGFGTVELDADSGSDPDDSEATTINVTKRIGKSGFRVYYEGLIGSDIFDGTDVYDQDQHLFGARMDF
jgi:hypothetical protein